MSNENYADEWETSSGLALDGANVTVTNMEFGFNANIGAGVVCANFTLTDDDTGEDIDQSFSVGGRNEASRDGGILEGTAKINKRSNFGMLIESVKDVVDDPSEVIGRVRDAQSWIGTRWTFGTFDMETTNPSTGETKNSSKFIVTDYLGRADDTNTPTTKKATKAPAKKATKDDITGTDLWAELVTLAEKFDEHEDFVDAALEIDGVEGNRDLTRAVMKTNDGSVWAETHGEM